MQDGVVKTGSNSGGRLGKARLLFVFFFYPSLGLFKTRWKDGEDGLSSLVVRGWSQAVSGRGQQAWRMEDFYELKLKLGAPWSMFFREPPWRATSNLV
jgi:hypothetical protein